MKSLLVSLILWLPGVVHAQYDAWTLNQKQWYAASNVLLLADWATTRNLTQRYDEGFHEQNVLLGRHPSRDKVDLYFVSALIGHYFLADWLSSKNRDIYLTGVTVIEGEMVRNNLSIGLRLRF